MPLELDCFTAWLVLLLSAVELEGAGDEDSSSKSMQSGGVLGGGSMT